MKGILAVALASALLCLPFLGSPPFFDPDEGYYPAAAAESLEHGHPLDLTLNGAPRWEKPPLSYALMQVSFLLLGKSEFAARLPSVLLGAALVAILGLLVARVGGARAGLVAAVVLATSVGHMVMARAAHPEMALVLGTATAQVLLALWFVSPAGDRPRWMWWAAGMAIGFAFLAKGPSALALPALMLVAAMLVLPREGRPTWAEAGRVFGAAALLCLALAAPWFLWMGAKHPEFWGTVLGFVGDYAEKEPGGFRASPFFFVPVLVGAFLPWIVFLPGALRGLRRSDPSPAARFRLLMALAAGTAFLFWSLSSAKNPHYALAFLPPLAALVAASRAFAHRWTVAGLALAPVALVLGVLGSGIPDLVVGSRPQRWMAARIAAEGAPGDAIAVYRRRIPSLTFYAGRPVEVLRTPEALAEFVARPGRRFLVISWSDSRLLAEEDPARRRLVIQKFSDLSLYGWEGPGSPPPPAPAPAPPGGGPR